MEFLAGWIAGQKLWAWFALALVLIGLEIFAPTSFLIFPAISAAAVGVLVLILPDMAWEIQFLAFAVLGLISTWFGRRWLKRFRQETDHPTLNKPIARFVGHRTTLHEPLELGEGQIHMGDTLWQAVTGESVTIPAGTTVEVTAVDGTVLKVRVVESENG
ncbi:MAG: NfeD family protein [Rhodospirillaceae bacterium]|jgi:inner membrane protein|nr:NfeD family protein [Rhodospirillaceae bacterium]MBT6140290.1 NfeD family protein [Rhodospirillaceae bacterium]